jgi:hypothetical protein
MSAPVLASAGFGSCPVVPPTSRQHPMVTTNYNSGPLGKQMGRTCQQRTGDTLVMRRSLHEGGRGRIADSSGDSNVTARPADSTHRHDRTARGQGVPNRLVIKADKEKVMSQQR